MTDQVAHTPLSGPTTYHFGEATPKEWPQGEYVPKAVYDALLKDFEQTQEVCRRMTATAEQLEALHQTEAARIAELAAEVRQWRILVNQDENKPFAVGK